MTNIPPTNEPLLKCESVSKVFCANLKRSLWYGTKDITTALGSLQAGKKNSKVLTSEDRPLRKGEFWANKDINFEVRRGECLGLIGKNGAGKTTLLKMLNGILRPDTGRITIKGKLGALIALGAGFNPILTGRENIVSNAIILGLTRREINEKLEEIIDFSGIGDFIDSPVRNYSSGMQIRLGFAVASSINPDILILDEVLAVGDADFTHKCYGRINELTERSAVVLVSHGMEYISAMANKVGLMNSGQLHIYDDVNSGIKAYLATTKERVNTEDKLTSEPKFNPPLIDATTTISSPEVDYGANLSVTINFTLDAAVDDMEFFLSVENENHLRVMAAHSSSITAPMHFRKGQNSISFQITDIRLHSGVYFWSIFLRCRGSIDNLLWHHRAGTFSVKGTHNYLALIPYLPKLDNITY